MIGLYSVTHSPTRVGSFRNARAVAVPGGDAGGGGDGGDDGGGRSRVFMSFVLPRCLSAFPLTRYDTKGGLLSYPVRLTCDFLRLL